MADTAQLPIILIVDDEEDVVRPIAFRLNIQGYDVLLEPDGELGFETAVAEHPDLILLDIMMPKMSGFEVCKRLKSDPKTRDITIIMVTALNEMSDQERAAECGTDDYISKPIDKNALIQQVRNVLAGKARAS
jgi:two-component system cell cycle response regulator